MTSTGVFASPMLSRKTFASLYMISSFLFIIFKKIKSFISYPHYGLLPRTDTKHTDSTYRSHELSFSYGYELNSSVLCQIPGFLLCETVESDCIFSAPNIPFNKIIRIASLKKNLAFLPQRQWLLPGCCHSVICPEATTHHCFSEGSNFPIVVVMRSLGLPPSIPW